MAKSSYLFNKYNYLRISFKKQLTRFCRSVKFQFNTILQKNTVQSNNPEITQKVWSLVNALPHREAIQEADARGWVEQVVSLHGEAAVWHAIRLNGFGGSEIGVLVRNRGGARADFQASAHDIVAGKLMRKAPTETNGHMTRGHENEEPHARRFYVKYGALRDVQAFEKLKNAQGKRPWMRYSPDDVVQMPVLLAKDEQGNIYPSANTSEMKRWLIDYKAPSKVEQNDEVAFQYACQLTQGAILCAEAGVDLDGMMLSQFDWANWQLKDDVIGWDQDLGRLVLDAGSHYWGFVGRGEVPDFIRTLEATDLSDYAKLHLEAANMYADLSALSKATDERAKEIRAILLKPVQDKRLAGKKVSFGLDGAPSLVLGVKQMLDREATTKLFTPDQLERCSGAVTWDAAKMLTHLKSLDVPVDQFRVYDLDATKVYSVAAELGLDADSLVKEQFTLAPSKPVKQKMQSYVNDHYPLTAALVAREAPEDGLLVEEHLISEVPAG